MTDRVYYLFELEKDVDYTVNSFIKCKGSCGVYYYMQVSTPQNIIDGEEEVKTVMVTPGNNVYDYLSSLDVKTTLSKFRIRKTSIFDSEDFFAIVGENGELYGGVWILLT